MGVFGNFLDFFFSGSFNRNFFGIFFGVNGIFFYFWEFSLGVSMGDFGELWGGF